MHIVIILPGGRSQQRTSRRQQIGVVLREGNQPSTTQERHLTRLMVGKELWVIGKQAKPEPY